MASFWDALGQGAGQSLGGLFGSLLGGAAFGSGKGDGRGKQKRYLQLQTDVLRDPYGHAVRSARGAGLHPLFALGTSPSIGGSVVTGQSSSGDWRTEALARAGADLGGAVGSAKQRELNDSLVRAQTRKLESEADYWSAQATGKAPQPGQGAGSPEAAGRTLEILEKGRKAAPMSPAKRNPVSKGAWGPIAPASSHRKWTSIQNIEDDLGEIEAAIEGAKRSLMIRGDELGKWIHEKFGGPTRVRKAVRRAKRIRKGDQRPRRSRDFDRRWRSLSDFD